MNAFISALIGVVVIAGVAWGGLRMADLSSKTVYQSATGDVRLE